MSRTSTISARTHSDFLYVIQQCQWPLAYTNWIDNTLMTLMLIAPIRTDTWAVSVMHSSGAAMTMGLQGYGTLFVVSFRTWSRIIPPVWFVLTRITCVDVPGAAH